MKYLNKHEALFLVVALLCSILAHSVLSWERFDAEDMTISFSKCENHNGLLGVEMDKFNFDIYCADGSEFINNKYSSNNHASVKTYLQKIL